MPISRMRYVYTINCGTLLYSTDSVTVLSQAIFGHTLLDSSHFFEHGKLALASSPTE